jgi:uncharacterized membrane protein YgdD (TMEM256/DUF423 family)
MPGRISIFLGALLAGVGVAMGAMGAHYLKEVVHLEADKLATYDTGVQYQMYHALGLILVGLLTPRFPSRLLSAGALLLVAGCLLFSGGIYGWIFTGARPFVHVVPIGGTAWIIGWLLIAIAVFSSPSPLAGESGSRQRAG